MVPRARRPGRPAPLRAVRSAAHCTEPAAACRPAPRSPGRGRRRSRKRSRDSDGDREAPLAAPLIRAARRAASSLPPRAPLPSAAAAGLFSDLYEPGRVPLSSGARSPIAAEPLGTAEFTLQSRRRAQPRAHAARRGPAERRGTAPARPCRRGRGEAGGGVPGLWASLRRPPRSPAGPAAPAALPPGAGSRWRRWVRRGVPAALALPRPLVTRPAAHAVAFICLGRGPHQPIASGEHKEAVAAPCKSILAALICRRQKAKGVRSPLLPPHRVHAGPQRGCGADRRLEGRGRVARRGMTHWAAFLLLPLQGFGLFHTVPGVACVAPTFPSPFPFLPSGRTSSSSRQAVTAGPSTRDVAL